MNHRQLARIKLAQAVEVARHIGSALPEEAGSDMYAMVSVYDLQLLVQHTLNTAETLTILIDSLDALDAGGQGHAEA